MATDRGGGDKCNTIGRLYRVRGHAEIGKLKTRHTITPARPASAGVDNWVNRHFLNCVAKHELPSWACDSAGGRRRCDSIIAHALYNVGSRSKEPRSELAINMANCARRWGGGQRFAKKRTRLALTAASYAAAGRHSLGKGIPHKKANSKQELRRWKRGATTGRGR